MPVTAHPGGRGVALVCGAMLVVIGVGIYLISGIPWLLFMDGLRGLVVMICAYLYRGGAVGRVALARNPA